MTAYFHGNQYSRSFFEGWYFKHQTPQHTVIFIPAFHLSPQGQAYASLQVVLDGKAYYLPFRIEEFEASPDRLSIRLGQNFFSRRGCRIHLDLPECTLRGHILYGSFHSPKRSFMGPFSHLPLPCFHEVLSLSHSLKGRLSVNGHSLNFTGGNGYLEKDWGSSFPDSYLWLQCGSFSSHSSVMLTVARLTLKQRSFTACSSLILHNGKEYRLSTYQGGRLIRYSGRRIALRQGPYLLQIILPPQTVSCSFDGKSQMEMESAVLLHAPKCGKMTRFIEEHPCCPIRCQLYKGSKKILDEERNCGSFELV